MESTHLFLHWTLRAGIQTAHLSPLPDGHCSKPVAYGSNSTVSLNPRDSYILEHTLIYMRPNFHGSDH